MKKIIFIVICMFTLIGCNTENIQYIDFSSKPSLNYYTDKIRLLIASNKDYSIELFNKNFVKSRTLDDTEKRIIEDFLEYLPNANFKEYEVIDKKEVYQLRITFENEKYIIKIFDNNTLSIFPYDGKYNEDIVLMTDVPIRYNLYDFCYYIENNYKITQ